MSNSVVDDNKSLVLVDYKPEGYAVMTLNRPEKRNSMSNAAQARFMEVLAETRDAGLKAIVLTGAGDRSFCSGVDIHEPIDRTQRRPSQHSHSWTNVQEAIAQHPSVFIAAVNGFALGGGLTLVHNSELAVAADTATFGMPEIGFGQYAALAGPATGKRILPKHMNWMLFTAERATAAQALQWGIVNEVVPFDQLLPRAEEMAKLVCKYDAISLDYVKRASRATLEMSWAQGFDYGLAMNDAMAQSRPRDDASSVSGT